MIYVSSAAASELHRIMSERELAGWGLRVGVKGGGCSGLSYTMEFAAEPDDHDKIFVSEGIRLFCDPKSHLYLNGMTLDFGQELLGGGFKFLNPNAVQTCACGGSFGA